MATVHLNVIDKATLQWVNPSYMPYEYLDTICHFGINTRSYNEEVSFELTRFKSVIGQALGQTSKLRLELLKVLW